MGYKVYKHTTPSGKVYIGLTRQTPEARWNNGYGYKGCTAFSRAIEKYGWGNIKHEILYDDLTEEAKKKEIEMIRYYKSTDSKFGYNISYGGDIGISPPVNKYSFNGEFILRYDSATEAAGDIGLNYSASSIHECCRGVKNSAYGFVWRYDGDSFDKYLQKPFIISNGTRQICFVENMDYMKEVYQYKLNGELVKCYKNVYEIFLPEGCKTNVIKYREGILNCCYRKTATSRGFVWRFDGDEFSYQHKRIKSLWRPIVQCDINGNFLQKWDSITLAEEAYGLKLCEVLAGRNKTAGGYKWIYADIYYKDDEKNELQIA